MNAHLQIGDYPSLSPRNLMHKFRRDWSTCAWEKKRSFNGFELMIHFLAEEGFLNMHSDALLNLTPGVWIVESIEYFS